MSGKQHDPVHRVQNPQDPNKVKELHDTTASWKEKYERAVTHYDTSETAFEKKCQETQKQEFKKAEGIYNHQGTNFK
jgi:molecular chaperone GrpE (heat shock protein)